MFFGVVRKDEDLCSKIVCGAVLNGMIFLSPQCDIFQDGRIEVSWRARFVFAGNGGENLLYERVRSTSII